MNKSIYDSFAASIEGLRGILISAVLIALAFPPFSWGFLAWVGLVPLFWNWMHATPRQAIRTGFLWGVAVMTLTQYWVGLNSGATWWAAGLSTVASVLFLALNFALIGGWFALIRTKMSSGSVWILIFIWPAVELLRSFGTLGYPWISLAHTQIDYLSIIQHAEFTGMYGITFWLVALNAVVLDLIRRRGDYRIAIILLAVFSIPWFTGSALIPEILPGSVRIAVVQPNIAAQDKWKPALRQQHFDRLFRLTREAALDSPIVVIWPEAATPAYLRRGGRRYLGQIRMLLRDLQLPVLTGMPEFERTADGEFTHYNSVGLIDSNGIGQRYDKQHLVAFGEYIPLSGIFPALKALNLGQANFETGTSATVFSIDSLRFSVGICFESTFPALNREFVRNGAQFLVTVVNDGWFGNSSEPYQHAAQARFRAVELRRPFIRSANTGISTIVDARGVVIRKLPVGVEGVIWADIAPDSFKTFYVRFGDLFGWTMIGLSILLTGFAWRFQLREKLYWLRR